MLRMVSKRAQSDEHVRRWRPLPRLAIAMGARSPWLAMAAQARSRVARNRGGGSLPWLAIAGGRCRGSKGQRSHPEAAFPIAQPTPRSKPELSLLYDSIGSSLRRFA